MRPGGLWVHPGSFGSLWSALAALGSCGSLCSSELVVFTRVRHVGRWVNPGSLSSRGCALLGVGFMRGRWVQSNAP